MPVFLDLLVLEEIGRQLTDSSSHLHRKSVFAVLVGRGASLKVLGHERVAPARTAPAEADDEAVPLTGWATGAVPTSHAQLQPVGGTVTRAGRAVPPISRFPNAVGKEKRKAREFWDPCSDVSSVTCNANDGPIPPLPYSCAPPCTPGAASLTAAHFKTHCAAPLNLTSPCHAAFDAPAMKLRSTSKDELAGAGGWPLCVPRASVSVPSIPHKLLEQPREEVGLRKSRAAETLRGTGVTTYFSDAAVEVDDAEVVVVFATRPRQPPHAADSGAPAATELRRADPRSAVPAWLRHSRLVVPGTRVASVQQWAKPTILETWPKVPEEAKALDESGVSEAPAWPHVLELICEPPGTVGLVAVLFSLPSDVATSELREALRRMRQSSSANRLAVEVPGAANKAKDDGLVRAVRCELRLVVDLSAAAATEAVNVNVAAVANRGICEACRVGCDRIRVLNVRSTQYMPSKAATKAATADPASAQGPPAEAPSSRQLWPPRQADDLAHSAAGVAGGAGAGAGAGAGDGSGRCASFAIPMRPL